MFFRTHEKIIRWKLLAVGIGFLCVAVLMSFSAEPGLTVLPGHLPAAVSRLAPKGRLPATNNLSLAIGLPLRNPAELDELLRQLYDPASTNYHKFLTPPEFTARFGPTEQDYTVVIKFVEKHGLKVTHTHPNRLVLDIAGDVAHIEDSFQVILNRYAHPKEQREFFSPTGEPSVPVDLNISSISGLNNFSLPRPNSIITPLQAVGKRVVSNAGSGPGSGYMGGDFRAAYVPSVPLTGAGQSVALLQFDGYVSNDIAAYISWAGLGGYPISLTNVPVNGGVSVPGAGNGEVCLDIEMVLSMAPGVSKIIVYEGPNGSTSWSTMLSQIANDNLAKQVSCSWGGGSIDPGVNAIFKQMATQGQSFFCASGDYDAYTTSVPFLLDNTNITLVGGTVLTTANAGGPYGSETVWNDRTVNANGGNWGSSGGVSPTYSIPGWQQGMNMSTNLGSTTMRNLPDVALTGKNCFIVADTNQLEIASGTSCAAPLWAGFMALANEQATTAGRSPVGFLNPSIYSIGIGTNYTNCLHDITSGDNFWSGSPTKYPAVAGFDLCTGWGSPVGQPLLDALVGVSEPLGVFPDTGFTIVRGPIGGPFASSPQNVLLTNFSAAPLAWSVINTSVWLMVSASSGTLAVTGQTNVVVSVNSAGNAFSAGTYSATMIFSNQTSGIFQSRQINLQVFEPLQLLTTNGLTFFGVASGPFYPFTQTVVFTNQAAVAQNWSLINTSAWLVVSAAAGSIAGNGSVSVTVSTNAATAALANGTYPTTMLLSNQSSHSVQSLVFSVLVGQSLVQNGGFETGNLNSWTLSGNSSSFTASTTSTYVHSGTYGLNAPGNSLGYITQNLPTVPGQTYQLSFWFLVTSTRTGQAFQANWNGATVYSTATPPTSWNNQKLIVTATSTNTPLQFGLNSASTSSRSFALDDISATPVNLPVITQSPVSQTNLIGSNIVFAAAASGTAPLGYQWRTNGVNLANGGIVSGATTSTLALTGITSAYAGNYTLVITNTYGSVTSSVAALIVVLPPSFTGSVTNRALECGKNTNTFAIIAAGTVPLSIQWSTNGVPVLGATNISFSLTNLHLPSQTVAVAVTNLYGTATSNCVLTITDSLAPVITLNGASRLTNELGSVFTDPGATAADLCAGTVPVTTNGTVNTAVVGTNTLTYTATDGGNSATNTRTVVIRDTTPPTILWSFTNLVMAANTSCVAQMTNVTGTNFILATDFSGALTISQSPTNNAVLLLGTNVVVITVADASGNQAFSTNRIIVRDQTPPLIALNGYSPMTNELGSAFADPGVTASDTCSGIALLTTNGVVNVSAVGTNTLTYIAVDGRGNTNSITRLVIVRDTTPPAIVRSFTNLVLALDTNCSAAMPDVTGTNFILASDLSGAVTVSQTPTNTAVLQLGTNAVVLVAADASGNTAYSTNQIVVVDSALPVFVTQPQSQTNVVGTSATFTAAATACTPLAWQWWFNSTPLTAQTNSTLTLSNLVAVSAGNYSVVAASAGGSSTSAVATLTVNLFSSSVALAASVNPAGFKDSLNFTAVVAPTNATGTVQFFTNTTAFDLEPLVAGAAASTNLSTLPRGTNLVTAIYSGDGSYLPATNSLAQIVTNHPPVVTPAFYTLVAGLDLNIAVADLATNWSDADGDALVIAAIATSTNGVAVTNTVPTLFYSNPNFVSDQFVCTVSDGFGGTNFQTVTITVVPQTNSTPNIAGVASQPPGVSLKLTGGYGSTYILESTTNFPAGDWSPVATNTLGVTGVWQFTDTQAAGIPNRFYRLKLVQ